MESGNTHMTNINLHIAQAKARLQDLQTKARKQARRDDTRRKVLYGAAVLQLLDDVRGEKGEKLRDLLDKRITRASDREFLELPERMNTHAASVNSDGQ